MLHHTTWRSPRRLFVCSLIGAACISAPAMSSYAQENQSAATDATEDASKSSREIALAQLEAIEKLIAEQQLIEARAKLLAYEQAVATGEIEADIRRSNIVKLRWITALQGELPEGLDAKAEAIRLTLGALEASEENFEQVSSLRMILRNASNIIHNHGSADEAADMVKTVLDRVVALYDGTGTAEPLSTVLVLPSEIAITKDLAQIKQIGGKPEEAEALMAALFEKLERLAEDSDDANTIHSYRISAISSSAFLYPESKQQEILDRAVAAAEELLEKNPDPSSVASYTNAIASVSQRLTNSDPVRANELLNAALDRLRAVSESNEQLQSPVKNSVLALERIATSLQSAIRQLEMIGKPAPAFDPQEWVNGAPVTQEELKGKVVLVDFWAVWCGPCIATFPKLKNWHEEYSDKGLVIVGVSSQYGYVWDEESDKAVRPEDPSKVELKDELVMLEKFIASHGLLHRTMVTPKQSEMAKNYAVRGIPHVALLDQEGNVALIQVGSGSVGAARIESKIKELLKIE